MTTDLKPRIAFLLGAGVSIPAGMPSTKEITEKVLTGNGVKYVDQMHRGLGRGYTLVNNESEKDDRVHGNVEFLKVIKDDVLGKYYSSFPHFSGEPININYEELYYSCLRINTNRKDGYVPGGDPTVEPLIDYLLSLPSIKSLHGLNGYNEDEQRRIFFEVAGNALTYIKDIVWGMLCEKPDTTEHVNSIIEAYNTVFQNTSSISGIDIFTLNHDTVLEQFFSEKGVRFTDGFELKYIGDKSWWIWDNAAFNRPDKSLRLFKLHGSVNWYYSRVSRSAQEFVIRLTPTDNNPRLSPLSFYINPAASPIFLLGNQNKRLAYTSWIYGELFYLFRKSLRETMCLVISGYSFGDSGINTQILEWLDGDKNRIMTIIDIVDKESIQKKIGLSFVWDHYKNQIRIVGSRSFESISWYEIELSLSLR